MKKIIYICSLIIVVISFVSCSEKETIYNGPAELGFAADKISFKVVPGLTKYTVNYGLTTNASSEVKCDLTIIKNTNLEGNRIHIQSDPSTLVIPAGKSVGILEFYAVNEEYIAGVVDTLVLAIKSQQVGVSYYDTMTVYSQQLCPVSQAADLVGNYMYYDGADFDPMITCTITHVAGDTLLVDVPTSSASYWWGSQVTNVMPFKIIVNIDEFGEATTSIAHGKDGQPADVTKKGQTWFTTSQYGRIVLYPTTNGWSGSALKGEVDYCKDYLEILFGMGIPDYSTGTYSFTGSDGLPLKRVN